MTVPWAKPLPKRHDLARWEDGPVMTVWLLDEGDVWTVHCLDCGTRIGTTSQGNNRGAIRLTEDHNRILHG